MPKTNMEERKDLEVLWSPLQVAKYFSINIMTVYRWIKTGHIDKSRVVYVGRHIRIPRSEVERIAGITKGKLENK